MLTLEKSKEQGKEVWSMKESSRSWLSANYYPQWKEVFQNYKCERDPEKNPNDENKEDPTQTSLGMPDTWSATRRKVARTTAQPPNLRFRCPDKDKARKISWKMMRDWDFSGAQKTQSLHVLQTALFGWSVRQWWWENDVVTRRRKVRIDETTFDEVMNQYGDSLSDEVKALKDMIHPDEFAQLASIDILKQHGVGTPPLVPLEYEYTRYSGPKTDFLFVGDCFPEPRFRSIRDSGYFMTQRWRDQKWMKKMVEEYPHLKDGFDMLLRDESGGTDPNSGGEEYMELRRDLADSVGIKDYEVSGYSPTGSQRRWLITECHYPAPDYKIAYIAEGGMWIGEIEYPYMLDGRIAFSEMTMVPDLLYGIGDSDARITRGLQALHNRNVSNRQNLIHNIVRPFVATTNPDFYEDPDAFARGKGFRVILVNHPNEFNVVGEQAAMAAVINSLQDSQDIQRLIQQAVGENNLSGAANIDPQQNRTATGARLLAHNQDVLTRALINEAIQSSVKDDAELMYLLNRDQMLEPVLMDVAQYSREDQGQQQQMEQQGEAILVSITPEDFQVDGDPIPEAGSTVADDDEANFERAQYMFAQATARPDLFNVTKARDELLKSLGKGREIGEWVAPPEGPKAPTDQAKVAISMKYESLPPEVQALILHATGLSGTVPQPEQGGGTPPAPPMAPNMPGGPVMEQQAPAVGPASRAAQG